jgi:hypothetical protein
MDMRVYAKYIAATVPNMDLVLNMADEEVRKLPDFRKETYKEYLKFAILSQVAMLLLPLISTIPDILIKNVWWPLYTQLGISLILSIWIFWLLRGIRKADREISVREIMMS